MNNDSSQEMSGPSDNSYTLTLALTLTTSVLVSINT